MTPTPLRFRIDPVILKNLNNIRCGKDQRELIRKQEAGRKMKNYKYDKNQIQKKDKTENNPKIMREEAYVIEYQVEI